MAKDDYFKIIYVILKELYEHLKDGTVCPVEDIAPLRFQVPDSYWLSIISDLVDRGYIKGPVIRKTKTGRAVANLDEMEITYEGIEYLEDNSTMKKVYAALKDVRDWVPGI